MIQNLIAWVIRAIPFGTIIMYGSMGETVTEKSGHLNLGVPGIMYLGGFAGFTSAYFYEHNAAAPSALVCVLLSLVCAFLAAMLGGLIYAFLTITLRANQVVTGLAVNAIAAAVTSLLFRQIFGLSASVPRIETFETLPIPLLRDIPVLGVLFEQTAVGYLAFLLVPLTTFVLRRTRLGLTVRSVGENPLCCDTLGIHVQRTRYLSVLYGSMMAGLGGAFVSMGQLSFFTVGMIAGRGYMTLAAIVFGNYTPWGIMLACVLFGAVSSLQYMLQATSSLIPYQLWVSFPYLFAVLALCLYRTRSKAPACSGQPFVRK